MDIDKERQELLAMTMANGILESIDSMDDKHIDKEYVRKELEDWIKRREHLI